MAHVPHKVLYKEEDSNCSYSNETSDIYIKSMPYWKYTPN